MNKRISWFVIAVLAQTLILAAVPARKIYTRQTGRTVVLKCAPVDPYNIMSGYYVILSYEISRPQISKDWHKWRRSQTVWVVLQKGDNEVWDAVSVHDSRPTRTPDSAVVIKGRKGHRTIIYGIESYFIPEDARHEINQDLRKNFDKARVEVKVDSFGHAALIKLMIEDRVYEY